MPSNSEFLQAISEKKIADSENESLVQALRYAMLLVGIRAANMPAQVEFDVLKDFIRRTYPGHTPSEIRLAFSKAVAGELPLKPNEVSAYENFSCAYFGRIMQAYRIWASDQYSSIPPTFISQQIEGPKPSSEEILDSFYQEFITGNTNTRLLPEFVYDLLAKTFDLNFTEEQMHSFVLRAREMVLAGYMEDLKHTDADKKLGQYIQIRDKKEALKAMDPLDSCKDSNVNRQAKILAVIHYFTSLKEGGIKTLTIQK